MSNVETESRTVTEHRFIVPCEEPWGGTPADLHLAIHLASEKAKELGVDVGFDDWCSIHIEDENIVLVVKEKR